MKKMIGLTHAIADCSTCGRHFESKNSMGLAAQHAKVYGHSVAGEIGIAFRFNAKRKDKIKFKKGVSHASR